MSASPPLAAPESRHDRARAARVATVRRRVAAFCAAVLLVSWNAVAVLGSRGGARAIAGASASGSIDVVAPVSTRQS